jgi:hypothetical protein
MRAGAAQLRCALSAGRCVYAYAYGPTSLPPNPNRTANCAAKVGIDTLPLPLVDAQTSADASHNLNLLRGF